LDTHGGRNLPSMTALHLAATMGNVGMVELCLKGKAAPDAVAYWSRTPLQMAARSSSPGSPSHLQVAKMLVAAGAHVDAQDIEGQTALMYAVKRNNLPFVELLLEHGAMVLVADLRGATPAHHAILQSNNAMFSLFLQHYPAMMEDAGLLPVSIQARFQPGIEAFGQVQGVMLAIMDVASVSFHLGPLWVACFYGYKELVERFFLPTSVDTGIKSSVGGSTLLHRLVYWGTKSHEVVLQYLLKNGVTAECTDNYGRTAYELASLIGNQEMMTIFMRCHYDVADTPRDRFCDTKFCPSLTALSGPATGTAKMGQEYLEVEWRRAGDTVGSSHDKLFGEGGTTLCARLGDPFLVAMLPSNPRDHFVGGSLEEGKLQIEVDLHGSVQVVTIDDWIPVVDGQPAFCQADDDALWPALYVKALAKVAGCYEAINRTRTGCSSAISLMADTSIMTALVTGMAPLCNDNLSYVEAVREFCAVPICARQDNKIAEENIGTMPPGLHPVPTTHRYGPREIGQTLETFTMHGPAVAITIPEHCPATGVAVSAHPKEEASVPWYQKVSADTTGRIFVLCLCQVWDNALELIDSHAWHPGTPMKTQLGALMEPGASCIAFLASTGRGSAPITITVNADGEVDVREAHVHGQAYQHLFEDGTHLAARSYAAKMPAPAPVIQALEEDVDPASADAKQHRIETFKKAVNKAKNVGLIAHHHPDAAGNGLQSALSHLEPEAMLSLLNEVHLPGAMEAFTPEFSTTLNDARVIELIEEARDASEDLRQTMAAAAQSESSQSRSPSLRGAQTVDTMSPHLEPLSGDSPMLGDADGQIEQIETLEQARAGLSHGVGPLGKYEWQLDSDTRRRAFEAVDVDGDGQITIDEVVHYLIKLDPEQRPQHMQANPWSRHGKAELTRTASVIDKNNDGYISFEELYGYSENQVPELSPKPTDVLGLGRMMHRGFSNLV